MSFEESPELEVNEAAEALADELKEIKPKGRKPKAKVESEDEDLDQDLPELAELKAQIKQAHQLIVQLQADAFRRSQDLPKEEVEQEIDPLYEMVSVLVPSSCENLYKKVGYDEHGDSFLYTPVKVGHKPPGCEHHKLEEYHIQLDTRSIVPRFVAETLGTRVAISELTQAEKEQYCS